MQKNSFILSGNDIEILFQKGFSFFNYMALNKNSVVVRNVIPNFAITHFLKTNDHLFTLEIKQNKSIFLQHITNIKNNVEQIVIEYCVTSHRAQFIMQFKHIPDNLSSFNQLQLELKNTEINHDLFIAQLNKTQLLSFN